jgi:SAM-dependent methyltransferase
MPAKPYRPDPVPVTLSDVYAMDFGRRTDDLALWAALAARAIPGAPICEVGVGDGRASAGLAGERFGLDLDQRFVYRARERGIEAFQGDAADPLRWKWNKIEDCGLVFCAYSTLFLIPHAKQAAVLRNMADALRPGGTLAVEVFTPSLTAPTIREVAVGNPNGTGDAWTRQTTFEVIANPDGLTGITRATRLYGPDRDEWRMELEEIIYWRTAAGLVALLDEADLPGAYVATYSPGAASISLTATIPLGSVLATWTRPLEASP